MPTPYSPDLAPSDFHLFSFSKGDDRGKSFSDDPIDTIDEDEHELSRIIVRLELVGQLEPLLADVRRRRGRPRAPLSGQGAL
ncbi:hypothetical protein EVAR_81060_1 [Eumeta japonica]|uniref:Mariner Mos1 transposase n=1 Tax=Eumeta variegata TaxID=151549 RepID=A0A4C1T6G0_EUMVA|nr:hypothetical protein EVAR_81060_1 [Eumeta japonica]